MVIFVDDFKEFVDDTVKMIDDISRVIDSNIESKLKNTKAASGKRYSIKKDIEKEYQESLEQKKIIEELKEKH